jgi:hypothetical protein
VPVSAHTPTVKGARQFFDQGGNEFFVSEAKGRRPDVPDALRTIGIGPDRARAEKQAVENWQAAWRALHPALQVADPK